MVSVHKGTLNLNCNRSVYRTVQTRINYSKGIERSADYSYHLTETQ